MTADFDTFSILLLEEAKRFLEKAVGEDPNDHYLHAALVLGFSAFESHLNGVANELELRKGVELLDRAILTERSMRLDGGEWKLGDQRFYRLEDRVQFLFSRFGEVNATATPWWSTLKEAILARNQLVHPREVSNVAIADVRRFLEAIVNALDALYRAVFKKGHPGHGRGLDSALAF